MKPLTIQLVKGKKRKFQSIGWKVPKEGDYRRQFYALGQNGKPLVVTLRPAIPRSYIPGSTAIFRSEPFPEAVCVEILPCLLLPPPCFRTRKEFDNQLPALPAFDPWQAMYWDAHKQVLILKPSDSGPLRKCLNEWLAVMRRMYERETAGWRERIERVATAPLQELGFDTEDRRAKELAELNEQLAIVESDVPLDGVPCKGRLKLTLADVKNGHEGIRNAWLQKDWAGKNGEDLQAMSRERRLFRNWLQTRTSTLANVFDATTRQRRQEIAPPNFGERYEGNPPFLEACAKVKFQARFAGDVESTVFVGECEVREELTGAEIAEVERLRGLSTVATPVQPHWHSKDFREIFRYNRTGKRKTTVHPTNALRTLCLLLARNLGKPMPFTRIEPKIGKRAAKLDNRDDVRKGSNVGSRQIRDLLRTKAGQKLKRWGVLSVSGVRERFVTLAPPIAK